MRAGACFLLMATDPINRALLERIAEQPLQVDPEHEFRVTSGGREVLFVAFVADRWLEAAPHGPLLFDSPEAGQAVLALAEGWTATIVHVLARGPHTFEELLEATEDDLSRAELEYQLAEMQRAHQVEVLVGDGGMAIYAANEWLRAGIAALIASARLERREPHEDAAPIDTLDVEAGFLSSLSLVELRPELSGVCSLGLRLDEDEDAVLTGVTARIDQGQIVSCEPGLDRSANAWATGTAGEWLDTVIEPDVETVHACGDRWLAQALVRAMHETLFGAPSAPPPEPPFTPSE
jgi:DNA-binding transcriptional ArsR family regulator